MDNTDEPIPPWILFWSERECEIGRNQISKIIDGYDKQLLIQYYYFYYIYVSYIFVYLVIWSKPECERNWN